MQVLQVKEYNKLAENRYNEAVKEYHAGKRETCPFWGLFCYTNNHGWGRQTGYVAYNANRSVLRKTKKEAIQAFNK